MDAVTSDRPLIHGEGTEEATWLRSACLNEVPNVPLDELVPGDRRLLVVAPHPDDEVLACGGLLFSHLGRGGCAEVIAVTDGEASHAGEPNWQPDELATMRRRESAMGLRSLGARGARVHRLGLPDGGVTARQRELQERLQILLHAGDVVVSMWHHDGHPDHEATAAACRDACARSGCGLLEAPVWMWHWSRPGDPRVPWPRLRAFRLSDDVRRAKRQALQAHRSQLLAKASGAPPILGPAILARARRPHEYFFL